MGWQAGSFSENILEVGPQCEALGRDWSPGPFEEKLPTRRPSISSYTNKKPPSFDGGAEWDTISDIQIIAQHGLQQIVTIHLADHGTGILIGRDVGGVFGQDIAHQLVDRIVAFFL